MIEDVYNFEGIYELFKKYDGVAEENCFFYALYEKPITPAEVAAAVFLAGAVNAVGGSVIGVHPSGNAYPAYLINQNENGIGMIPLEPATFTVQYPINKMKIVDNAYIFISQEDIKNVKVKKNPLCLKPSIRFVTIETKNGNRFHFRVSKKDKFLSYQENGFLNFEKKYAK